MARDGEVEGTAEQDAARREAAFWDAHVNGLGAEDAELRVLPADLSDRSVPWLAYLDAGRLTARVFAEIGLRPGLRVLDLGSGNGFASIALAHRGAEVEGVDISPASVDLATRRAALSGVTSARFRVMDCQALEFPDGHFDAVCGSFVLHHLDLPRVGAELARVLKPGGRGAFIETMGYNPLLMLARAALPGRMGIEKASSPDEYPLTPSRVAALRRGFGGEVRAVFPQLVFARMGGYIPMLNTATVRGGLLAFDRGLEALGFCNAMSYFGLITLHARPG